VNPLQYLQKAASSASAIVTKATDPIRHVNSGSSWFVLPRTKFDYAKEVDPENNSAVAAAVGYVARNFPEAPAVILTDLPDSEPEIVQGHPMAELLHRPNSHHSGTVLWMALLSDFLIAGNAYLIKLRNEAGVPVELWWAPSSTIEPEADPRDPTVFIKHYKYEPGGGSILYDPSEIVHLRNGIALGNNRKGKGALGSALREIFTDDEAANFTATILRNLGVPGVILSPDGDVTVDPEERKQIRARWNREFGGDNRGGLMVASGKTKVTRLSFTPQELNMQAIRDIPESRIAALLGIPAAVVGLLVGLKQTAVGATLAEYRELAFENGIIPLQRLIAEQLDVQLLRDFSPDPSMRTAFDLRNVRVLQEDENRRHERLRQDVSAGLLTRADFKRGVGLKPDPSDDVYLIPMSTVEVPVGERMADGLPDAPDDERALEDFPELKGLASRFDREHAHQNGA